MGCKFQKQNKFWKWVNWIICVTNLKKNKHTKTIVIVNIYCVISTLWLNRMCKIVEYVFHFSVKFKMERARFYNVVQVHYYLYNAKNYFRETFVFGSSSNELDSILLVRYVRVGSTSIRETSTWSVKICLKCCFCSLDTAAGDIGKYVNQLQYCIIRRLHYKNWLSKCYGSKLYE